MIQLFLLAFTTGMIGSLHCLGMCGPIAIALPLGNRGNATKLIGAMLYNSGRILTYSMLGLFFGIMGQAASFFGFQQWLSLVAGILILLFVLVPEKFRHIGINGKMEFFFAQLRERLGQFFRKENKTSLFAIGILNGLLPCGLLYMALAASVSAGSMKGGALFMFSFGLGTVPMMLGVTYLGKYIRGSFRQNIRILYPYMIAFMGCLLIVRGLGLGIPFLSPGLTQSKKEIIGCCANPVLIKPVK